MSEGVSSERAAHDRQQQVDQVFELFALQWPRAFLPEQRDRLRKVWRMALSDVPATVIVPAATRYLAKVGGKYAPDAPTFAEFARELSRKHTQATAPVSGWHPKSFWYETDGYDVAGKPATVRKTATEVPCGGYAGISEPEMDALYAGTRPWGWL